MARDSKNIIRLRVHKRIRARVSGTEERPRLAVFRSVKHIYAQVIDDGKGWVWLAAEMSPGGLAVELFKSVPYGKRAILVANQNNVDELFEKVNWNQATANIEKTFGGPAVKQR